MRHYTTIADDKRKLTQGIEIGVAADKEELSIGWGHIVQGWGHRGVGNRQLGRGRGVSTVGSLNGGGSRHAGNRLEVVRSVFASESEEKRSSYFSFCLFYGRKQQLLLKLLDTFLHEIPITR